MYPISKPTYPVTIKILGAAVLLGLAGLGLVAYSVFSMIDTPAVAAAFALVIELGAVSEAIALIKRNRLAAAGLVISLGVSGIYNYTRAAAASTILPVPLSDVELGALALGPLAATFFLALTLGHELQKHDRRVALWQTDSLAWQTEREERRVERESARQAEAEARRLASEAEAQARSLASAERIERARIRAGAATARRSSIEVLPQRVELLRGTYGDFVEVLHANGREWKNKELAERFNVSTRTITDWRRRYDAERAPIQMQEN